MNGLAYPDAISEMFPEAFYSDHWRVEVWTDAFSGELCWVPFMSFLNGSLAWRIASSLEHTFQTSVRMVNALDITLIHESEA